MVFEGLHLWSSTVIRTPASFILLSFVVRCVNCYGQGQKEGRKEGQMCTRERDLPEDYPSPPVSVATVVRQERRLGLVLWSSMLRTCCQSKTGCWGGEYPPVRLCPVNVTVYKILMVSRRSELCLHTYIILHVTACQFQILIK